ncbi:MAG TPA: M14 family zinc carboxypeptidase [archaeon]|nr:M14 family zinc carboxypeptidase [archaeon]
MRAFKFFFTVLTVSCLAVSSAKGENQIPSFWKSRVSDIEEVLKSVSRGKVRQFGESYGHRPIYFVSYGEREPYARTANFSSAIYSGHPEAFCERDKQAKPVLLILGPVHGGELEGIVSCLNLIEILETGSDFRGQKWPGISSRADKLRIGIVPLANPDGRARLPYDSFVGQTNETMHKYSQGTRKDGTLYNWPYVSRNHPMVGDVGFLGAYFNDGGVNIYLDCFFRPMAPETRAIFDLAIDEAPDMIVGLHSHEMPAEFLQTYLVPPKLREWTAEIQKRYAGLMKEKGLPFTPPRPTSSNAFELSDALYHTTGAVSILFEGPQGIVGMPHKPIDYATILDSHLVMFEFLLELGLSKEGFMGREGIKRGDWR